MIHYCILENFILLCNTLLLYFVKNQIGLYLKSLINDISKSKCTSVFIWLIERLKCTLSSLPILQSIMHDPFADKYNVSLSDQYYIFSAWLISNCTPGDDHRLLFRYRAMSKRIGCKDHWELEARRVMKACFICPGSHVSSGSLGTSTCDALIYNYVLTGVQFFSVWDWWICELHRCGFIFFLFFNVLSSVSNGLMLSGKCIFSRNGLFIRLLVERKMR